MPNNNIPEQPRTSDGRYTNTPPRIPTSSPLDLSVVNAPLMQADLEALYERLQASQNVNQDRDSDEYWANTYHLRFKNFNTKTIEETKTLFSARPSTLMPAERAIVFKNWVDKISEIYHMDTPTFYWDEEADYGGGGFYRHKDHSITMSPNHPSIVTLIHETRHALQIKEKGAPMVSDDLERDARAWSLSLYYKTKPQL